MVIEKFERGALFEVQSWFRIYFAGQVGSDEADIVMKGQVLLLLNETQRYRQTLWTFLSPGGETRQSSMDMIQRCCKVLSAAPKSSEEG